MADDVHRTYLYDKLPHNMRHTGQHGFHSQNPQAGYLFPTVMTARDNTYPGEYYPDLPVGRQRCPIEARLDLMSSYRPLENRKVTPVYDLNSDQFYRMREFKERNAYRQRVNSFPYTMLRECDGCNALSVKGGVPGCSRVMPAYNMQNSRQHVAHYRNPPQAPYGRHRFTYFHELLDRCYTNDFNNPAKYL